MLVGAAYKISKKLNFLYSSYLIQAQSLATPATYSLTHSLSHSLTHSLTHSCLGDLFDVPLAEEN